MKLNKKDRDILAHAEMGADKSVAEIGQQSGFKEHTVRYFLERWKELGLITHRTYVNLFKLGYSYYEIYFSLSSEGQKNEVEIISQLTNLDRVTWLAKIGGDYQYGMTFCAKSIHEASDYLDSFAETFGKIFYERDFATRLHFSFFGNKYLSHERDRNLEFSISPSDTIVSIDETDHLILKALAKDSDISKRKIAESIQLPPSTFELRRKKLEDKGVLVGNYYYLKPASLTGLAYVVLVSTRGISKELRTEFKQYCRNQKNITTLIDTLGVWDFEMAVEVEHAHDMHELTGEMKNLFGSELHWIKVMPLFSFIKASLYPFSSFNSFSK